MKNLMILMMACCFLAASCKESKKEEVQDDSAIEMNDSDANGADGLSEEHSNSQHTDTNSEALSDDKDKEATSSLETQSKGIESIPVPEGVIAEELADTPVIYPGCTGTVDEIRACSIEKFNEYLKTEFDKDLAYNLGLSPGTHLIRALVLIDEQGKCSTLGVSSPHNDLSEEMKRVINSVKPLVPATKAREPIAVTFVVSTHFEVKD